MVQEKQVENEIKAYFISKPDLIKLKEYFHRKPDLKDVKRLKNKKRNR